MTQPDTSSSEVRIGNCRLILADSEQCAISPDAVGAVVTDPPYGIKAKTNNKDRAGRSLKGSTTTAAAFAPIVGDDKPFDPSPWLRYGPSILWGGNHYADRLPASSKWIIWDKRRDTTPDDNADCEMAWTNLRGVARIHRHLWRGICREGEENISRMGPKKHPAQKPISLMQFCLQQLPSFKGAVLDPYMGSGSTGIACMRMGIPFIGIEIDKEYFDIACERLETELQGYPV